MDSENAENGSDKLACENVMKVNTGILAGLPWIWISMDISMDISMCGYQT